MDRTCTQCGVRVGKGHLCRSCGAFKRWANRSPDYTPPTCHVCGEIITSRNRARAKYCSAKCKYVDPAFRAKIGPPKNQVTKTCPYCTREFSVAASIAHRYNYCSRECSSERATDRDCARCGAHYRRGRGVISRYCSETCRRPPVTITCDHCGESVRVVPSKEGRQRFCSFRCYRASDAETSIERTVRLALEAYGIRARAQAQVGPWVVDFLAGDLVIEADGTYWHSIRPDVDRRKNVDITARGYTVWRLPEDDINSAGFTGQFRQRLADYEITNGELPRLSPGETIDATDKHRMVVGKPKRTPIRDIHPAQLLLDL